ncbi:MAG: hypothetical protein D6761_04185, partial [Candidatus Dadabacteria bacterium]
MLPLRRLEQELRDRGIDDIVCIAEDDACPESAASLSGRLPLLTIEQLHDHIGQRRSLWIRMQVLWRGVAIDRLLSDTPGGALRAILDPIDGGVGLALRDGAPRHGTVAGLLDALRADSHYRNAADDE